MYLLFLKCYFWYLLKKCSSIQTNEKVKQRGMRKNWWRPLILLFIVSFLFKCIDPFSPQIGEFQSLIVVDALLTDENVSNYVYLSRTIEKVNDEPAVVSGALVIIKDNFGNSTTLSETSEGKYKTDSLVFRGEIGRSYTLYIKTADGTGISI